MRGYFTVSLLLLFAGISACFLFGPALVATGQDTDADEKKAVAAIEAFVRSYAAAFNKKDLDAVSAMWTADASHVDRETGERTEGREAIRSDLAVSFKTAPNARLTGQVDHVRLISLDVASVQGQVTLSVPEEEPTASSFSAILVRQNGRWLIDSIEDSPMPQPSTPYDGLRELEWLVGQWVDESETVRVDTTVRWAADASFLVRSYVVQDQEGVLHQGSQIIAWDPRSQQIRSWKFDSDGSFGDGVWSKNGDDWMIKSTQTLADGRAASGTYVLTRVDNDTKTVQLIGHEVEGEPVPSSDAVTVVRVAEETDAGTKQKTGSDKTEEPPKAKPGAAAGAPPAGAAGAVQHNGLWWRRLPDRRWAVWVNGRWVTTSPQQASR